MSVVLEMPKNEVVLNGLNISIRLINVDEYDQMIAHGILSTDDKVELLNGVLIEKMPKGTKHAALNDLFGEILREKLDRRAVVRNQNPVWLDDLSEPEPDIVLAKPPLNRYLENHPRPDDILLIVELSDT